jgi:hypothetical protein
MKNLLLTGLLSLLFFHENKQTPDTLPCGVQAPVEELFWLKEKLTLLENSGGTTSVYQFLGKGETIFSIEHNLALDARNITYYRCIGTVVCHSVVTIGGPTGRCDSLSLGLTDRIKIYPKRK